MRHFSNFQTMRKTCPHCLKITQNVSFEFYIFGIFHQFLTCLVTLFDRKLQLFKNSPNWLFLAFLINFCPKCKQMMRLFLRFSNTVPSVSVALLSIYPIFFRLPNLRNERNKMTIKSMHRRVDD